MNIKFHSLLFILSVIFTAPEIFAGDISLEKLWQLDDLANPESVVHDEQTNSLYVSNINGSSSEKDNNGFISKVSLEGEIMEKHWVTGLNAPKGLAIHNNHLYVADITELVKIDIARGEITNRFSDEEAQFFNDVAATADGVVYVADSKTNTIHQLKDGTFSRWLISPDLRSPNGLLVENDRMLITAWGTESLTGQVLSVSMQDKSISIIGDKNTEGNLDGIERNSSGDYFITEWTLGKLLLLKHSGEVLTLLRLEKGMADLDYIESRSLLILPMLKTNKLIAYKIR